MDFNDIQSAWNNDQNKEVKLPDNLEKLQSANTPLDKIRKNLKNEFIYQILAIVFIGFFPFQFHFSNLMKIGYYGLYVLLVVICTYFLVKLYWFFKRLNKANASTKDNLYETYYDIRLNMELYKSFTYSIVPFALIFIGMIFVNDFTIEQLTAFSNEKSSGVFVGVLLGVFVFVIVTIALLTEWWVNHFYGKYAKEIRKIIDELKE